MASFITCKSLSPTPYPTDRSLPLSPTPLNTNRFPTPAVRFTGDRRVRGIKLRTQAGPSSSQYLFAFLFPFSLLAITVFTAWRIGDRLDEKFFEELSMNEAIRAADEEDDDGEPVIPREEEPALSQPRNRPKREV